MATHQEDEETNAAILEAHLNNEDGLSGGAQPPMPKASSVHHPTKNNMVVHTLVARARHESSRQGLQPSKE